jgi:hypothetical protein
MPPLFTFLLDLADQVQGHSRDLSVTAEPVAERARGRARDVTIRNRGELVASVQVDSYDLRTTGNLVAQVRRPGDQLDVVVATPNAMLRWFADSLLPALTPAPALAGAR